MGPYLEIALHLAVNALLALAAFARRSLTPGGTVAAALVGFACSWGGGPTIWALLAAFFVTSTLWSRYRSADKRTVVSLTGKTDRRDAAQVLANGAPAAICVLAWRATAEPAVFVAAAAALAQANADTWASEIGLLSSRTPRSLLTLAPVPRGHSGGVTALGIAGAAGGSFIVGAVLAAADAVGLPSPAPAFHALVVVWAAGFAGALLDSVLGQTLQARYRAADGGYTERAVDTDGRRNLRVRGLRGVGNDAVNLASGAAASALVLLYGLSAW